MDYFHTKDKSVVYCKIKPVTIMFSEYYFYLTAFIDDEEVKKNFDVLNDSFPTIYRIGRIKKMTVLDERFHIPYNSRFEEGEFRKRIQFMYGGKLRGSPSNILEQMWMRFWTGFQQRKFLMKMMEYTQLAQRYLAMVLIFG